jgi:uncharacterized ion transporter superfamily protein YfcC
MHLSLVLPLAIVLAIAAIWIFAGIGLAMYVMLVAVSVFWILYYARRLDP